MGDNNIFAVPMAVIVGIPLYADATTIIPIAEVLIQKRGSNRHGFSFYDDSCLPFFAWNDYFIKSNEKRINYKICDFYVSNLYFSWVFL